MKNRYEVRAIFAMKDGINNGAHEFFNTLELAQASAFLIQMLCVTVQEREYTIKIIDTKTNEIVKVYES